MNRSIISVLAFTLCLSSGDLDRNGIVDFNDFAIFADNWLKSGDNGSGSPDQNEVERIMIVLTRLEITEKALELSYKIKNNSDHDVWVCDYIWLSGKLAFEVYLAEDNQTLLMRRRLDLPTCWGWYIPPFAKYVRLRPGEERIESLSLTVPVFPEIVFMCEEGKAEYATRLVMQIGFYDEELPEMVLGILAEAEKIVSPSFDLWDCDLPIIERYFGGLLVQHYLRGLSGFKDANQMLNLSEEVSIEYTYQALKGERFSELVIDGVSIPYRPFTTLVTHGEKRPETGKDRRDAAAKKTSPSTARDRCIVNTSLSKKRGAL